MLERESRFASPRSHCLNLDRLRPISTCALLPGIATVELLIETKPMAKWDQRFCELAQFVSEWSKDPNAKVGAVIVAKRGGDVAIGYNGFPMGVEDSADRLQDPKVKLELVVHAEQNALIAAGSRTYGSTLYVWGKPICARCAGSIIQAGVKRVVALSPTSLAEESKWRASGNHAHQMFLEAGIEVDLYVFRTQTQSASNGKIEPVGHDVRKQVIGHPGPRAANSPD
jgi:dCMP deaminase